MLIKSIKTETTEEMIEISLPVFVKSRSKYAPEYRMISENGIIIVACNKEMIYKQRTTEKFIGEFIADYDQISESEYLAAYVTAKANLDLPIIQKEAI